MSRVKALLTELGGLFVEDEVLAILVLATVGAAAIFRDVLNLGPAVSALVLLGGSLAALVFCVWRMARIASR